MAKRRKYIRRSSDYVFKQYDAIHLAYLAGIVDGEGCFFINKLPKKQSDGYITEHYRGILKIDNTDVRLLDWIDTVFSGTSSSRTRYTSTKKFWRTVHTWNCTGERLLDICQQILPYLVIKKDHCANMIKFRKTYHNPIGSNKLSEETIAVRQECLEANRKLNTRWHLHPLKHNS